MKTIHPRIPLVAFIFVYAIVFRLLPYLNINYPWNLTPLYAICLFGGAAFQSRNLALAAPIGVMVLSNIGIGLLSGRWDWAFTPGQTIVWMCLMLFVVLGFNLQTHRPVWKIAGNGLLGCVLWYLITNFAVWVAADPSAGGPFAYEKSFAGLMQCYYNALPFFRNDLVATTLFGVLLFSPICLRQESPEPVPATLEQAA